MSRPYRKYAQVHTVSYQGRWWSYQVLDRKIIDAHKTVPMSHNLVWLIMATGNTCLFWFMSIRTVKWYPCLQLATTTFMSNSECISCRERYFKEVLSCENFIFHLEGLHPVQ